MLCSVQYDPAKQANAVHAWNEAFAQCRREGAQGVFFPAGVYHFYQEGTTDRYCFVSNHDEGVRAVVFDLEEVRGFTLAGDDALLMFHGRLSPLFAEHCRSVTIRGLRFDFTESFVVEALVTGVDGATMDLEFSSGQFYGIEHQRVFFINDRYRGSCERFAWSCYDQANRQISGHMPSGGCSSKAVELAPGRIRLLEVTTPTPPVGATILLKIASRLNPAIVLDESRDILIEQVTINHAGGMGIIAQNCADIVCRDVVIEPSQNRKVSVADDAAHFVQCSGKIHLSHCRFEHQLDDAVNIHGIYRSFFHLGGGVLNVGQFQQLGVPMVRPGERLLIGNCCVTVTGCEEVNKQMTVIQTQPVIDPEVPDGTLVRNLDREAQVKIDHCVFRANRPRGVLASVNGSILIEHNEFHTPGAAVYIAGGPDFWFEAGPVNDLCIRHNLFDECLYSHPCGTRAVIDVHPGGGYDDGRFFHKNIRIEQNIFRSSHPYLIAVTNCNGLVIRGNHWEYQGDSGWNSAKLCRLEHCGNISIGLD